MALVAFCKLICEAPFVTGKHSTWFENAVDFAVTRSGVRRMARRLDRISSIERLVIHRHLHKVSLEKVAHFPSLCSMVHNLPALDLVRVVVQACDACTRERIDRTQRAANAATNIDHLVPLADAQFQTNVILMTANALRETLTAQPVRKVKALTPAVLVKTGHQVVVRIDELLIVASARRIRLVVRLRVKLLVRRCRLFNLPLVHPNLSHWLNDWIHHRAVGVFHARGNRMRRFSVRLVVVALSRRGRGTLRAH
mmetsp:Transcript_27116/g.88951  ORF Transcript_27116/g.88951 Transcript_27116/m.88951 type:complete len:254 (+) Transcript_27116:2207-2968(+)